MAARQIFYRKENFIRRNEVGLFIFGLWIVFDDVACAEVANGSVREEEGVHFGCVAIVGIGHGADSVMNVGVGVELRLDFFFEVSRAVDVFGVAMMKGVDADGVARGFELCEALERGVIEFAVREEGGVRVVFGEERNCIHPVRNVRVIEGEEEDAIRGRARK